MPERTRLTAVKTQIGPLTTGKFHPAEGFESAYVLTKEGMRVSRIRVLATVMNKFVSEDGQYGFIVLDDESETIRVKFFKDVKPIAGIEIGDFVDVIGKIRQYEGELYVQPEILRKVEDPNMLVLRLAELVKQKRSLDNTRKRVLDLKNQTSDLDEFKKLAAAAGVNPDVATALVQATEEHDKPPEDKRELKDTVLATIEKLDAGSGAEYGSVIKEVGLSETQIEPVINELLEDGTCFEPRPGRIKRL